MTTPEQLKQQAEKSFQKWYIQGLKKVPGANTSPVQRLLKSGLQKAFKDMFIAGYVSSYAEHNENKEGDEWKKQEFDAETATQKTQDTA